MAKQINWIPEQEALQILNRKDGKYFRRLVKKGTYNVSYRTLPSGRSFEYDAKAIEEIKNKNAVIVY
jgi:DNA-dependent RNA polymerase auxiliary subunit epsilon